MRKNKYLKIKVITAKKNKNVTNEQNDEQKYHKKKSMTESHSLTEIYLSDVTKQIL